LRRLLDTVGYERRAKDVTLSDYLAQKTHQRQPDADDEAS
jgi:hypothetical protein